MGQLYVRVRTDGRKPPTRTHFELGEFEPNTGAVTANERHPGAILELESFS